MPPAGYFVIADAAPLGVTDALAWCRTLPEEAGVAGVFTSEMKIDHVIAEIERQLS